MIQRIFHPIGQGAFYSEKHDNINIIFDCGNWKNTKHSGKVVKQSFDKNDEIDLLFISHFDYDHISKIPTLKKHVKKIKRVILPLLHDEEKILLSNIYRSINFKFLTLINNPKKYFGKETKIIYVEKFLEDNENLIDNSDPQNIDDITDSKIKSGTKITLNGIKDWLFIPFNFEYKGRYIILISELGKAGFNIKKLKSNYKYTINEIIKDTNLTKKQGGKKFKNIYNKLDGKINQNSMLLYSGPLHLNNKNKNSYYSYYLNNFNLNFCTKKVACIYTGDADLNKTSIRIIFKNYWKNIGTIQIPHHGDIKSFNRNELKDKNYCCPVSAGLTNSYGHPSSRVIGEILSMHSYPIFVNEKSDSMYIEIII